MVFFRHRLNLKNCLHVKCILALTFIELTQRNNCRQAYCTKIDEDTNSHTSKSSDCEKYNTLYQRLSWHGRKKRCNNDTSNICEFQGSSSFGHCVITSNNKNSAENNKNKIIKPEEQIKKEVNITNSDHTVVVQNKSNDTSSSNQPNIPINQKNQVSDNNPVAINNNKQNPPSQELNSLSQYSNTEARKILQDAMKIDAQINDKLQHLIKIESSIENKLQTIINDQLSTSIKGAANLAKLEAKEMILSTLQTPENIHKFGHFLHNILGYDSVINSTTELIYWSLFLPSTYNNTLVLLKYNVIDYWLNDIPLGRPYTHQLMIEWIEWWIQDPVTYTDVIAPLIYWTLVEKEMTEIPLKQTLIQAMQSPQIKVNI